MPESLKEIWKANHGNVLLATLVVVMAIGSGILLYQQNRFVPVEFPNAASIRSQWPTTEVDDENAQLIVHVVGAVNDSGSILVAIHPTSESFDGRDVVATQRFSVKDGAASLRIPLSILPEQFAISAFHDVNEDGALDRVDGVPTERYGFSGVAREIEGSPDFAAAVMTRPTGRQAVTIELK